MIAYYTVTPGWMQEFRGKFGNFAEPCGADVSPGSGRGFLVESRISQL
jgi:hypothetical protein